MGYQLKCANLASNALKVAQSNNSAHLVLLTQILFNQNASYVHQAIFVMKRALSLQTYVLQVITALKRYL